MVSVSHSYSPSPDKIINNRRIHQHLRDVFEDAYNLALPYIDPRKCWDGRPMVHHAYGALKKAYPQLGSQDLAILVPTLARTFRKRTDQ